MKQIFIATLTFMFSLVFSACSDEGSGNSQQSISQSKSDSVRKMSGDVFLNAEITKTDEGRVTVTGKTNLPDSTELFISILNEAVGFSAQDKSSVSNGVFSAGPLGPKSGLIAGNYVVEVMMPVPSAQSEKVQLIVGSEGQYLTGQLVKNSSWGGKTVEYSVPYTVGSKQFIQQALLQHTMMVSDIRSIIEQLLKNGRAMELYRNTNDLTAIKSCGEMMRKNQVKAKAIRMKAEMLPMKYYDLRVASIDVYSCVSCSGTAIQSCERIAKRLDDEK